MGWKVTEYKNIDGNQITLKGGDKLIYSHFTGEPVFLVMSVTYSIGMLDGNIRPPEGRSSGAGSTTRG